MLCRGLIVDHDWRIVARPFPKFFNWGELSPEDQQRLVHQPAMAVEKLDGALGIIYERATDGSMAVATRGSFDSPQALWATSWIRENRDRVPAVRDDWTDLVEIISSEHRIVVDYRDRGDALYYLASVFKATGQVERHEQGWLYTADEYPSDAMDDVLDSHYLEDDGTAEGFVFHWPCGTMAKVKFDEYLRLHRIVSSLSPRLVLEYLCDRGEVETLVAGIPEEHAEWVRRVASRIEEIRDRIIEVTSREFADIVLSMPPHVCEAADKMRVSRAAFAKLAKESDYPEILFRNLDGRPSDELVWKRVAKEFLGDQVQE